MINPFAKKTAESSPPVPLDSGLFWETKVADALGISRDLVRSLRQDHLNEGADFRTVRGAVVLSEQGLTRLNALLAAQDNTAPTATPSANAPESAAPLVQPGPPSRARFTVTRVPTNKHFLWCVPVGEQGRAPQVLVRVKANENFMRGMSLEAIASEHNSWQFRGRLPRRKGRW